MRVFRLLLWRTFLVGTLGTLYVFEAPPGSQGGNGVVMVAVLPQKPQQLEEYRRVTSTLTMC